MQNEAYEKLELEEAATILDRLNPLFDGAPFDPVESTLMAARLPFYPGCRIVDIADHRVMPPSRRYVIHGPKESAVVDFTNAPIYDFNKKIPIQLTEDNVGDYVRFFFTFVRGRHGRFLIVESVDDIRWKDDPPSAARRAIGNMVEPLAVMRIEADGTYHLEVRIVFRNSLFKSKVAVKKDGQVTLSDEELLVEDMPVLDDIFGQ